MSSTSAVSSLVAGRTTTFLATPTVSIVATAGQLVTSVISIPASAAPSKAAAQSILDGDHKAPNIYDAADPIKLFIIQVAIIVALCRLLAVLLAKLRQPRVISEVITGLLLGPSVFGRIPGFTDAIFPAASMANLTLVANLGLVFFLFLVGLEADFSVFRHNGRRAVLISSVGLVVPFGLGAAVSVGIYNKFVDTSQVNFGIFLLFIGTAMAITAFPVLARILTELKLLRNPVGLTVLAAGVGNDVVGWILLALAVALANAGNGVSAVYILLCAVGFGLLLFYIVRPVYGYYVRRSGSLEHGPTPGVLVLTFFLVLAGAFLTDIIGIHAIFGSFMVGILVVPHDHGFATALTEKIEDFVSILFIPIYFSLSGLKTNLGLLNNGDIWGWAICVIIIAFVSKFVSCGGVAKACGMPVRESLAVGALMSCKGLVELIVLNIGLNAGILNNSVFAMFVVMALVTTFATTPLTMWFYPESYWRPKQEAEERLLAGGSGPRDDEKAGLHGQDKAADSAASAARDQEHFRKRFVVVLERLESLPPIMSFVRLLQPSYIADTTAEAPVTPSAAKVPGSASSISDSESEGRKAEGDHDLADAVNKLEKGTVRTSPSQAQMLRNPTVSISAHRLLPLTERTSSLFKASEEEQTMKSDPILNIFGSFANLASVPFTTSMSIVPQEEFPERVISQAANRNADMVVVPWAAGTALDASADQAPSAMRLESLFGNAALERSPQYASFVRQVFLESPSDVALVLDGGVSANSTAAAHHKHIYLPFHGGPDDRAALDFVMQLVSNNADMTATVARFVRTAANALDIDSSKTMSTGGLAPESSSSPISPINQLTIGGGQGHQDTVYAGAHNTQHRLASDTADNLALARYFPANILGASGSSDASNVATPRLAEAGRRVIFETINTPNPLHASLLTLQSLRNASRSVLVIVGRSRHSAPSHRVELESYLKEKVATGQNGIKSLGIAASSEVRKTLGDLGSALVASGSASSVIILQSAVKGSAFMNGKGKKAKAV